MLLKKSAIAVCSSASPSPAAHLSSLTSSLRPSPPPPPQCQARQRQCQQPQCRAYATQQSPDDRLPDWPRSANPTPYEIFDIGRSTPYTKKRFYQLVKLYHPDKHHKPSHTAPTGFTPSLKTPQASSSSSSSSSSKPLPGSNPDIASSTRLERYRLVVAANDLLSSPSKRQLYDNHGIGWLPSADPSQSNEDLRRADRAWRHAPGSAAHNATWEDWERWHAQNNPTAEGAINHDRRPLYMSNRMFASLVVIMCMIGALAQRSRAQSIGEEYVEWKAQKHAAIGQELGRRGDGNGRDGEG